MTCLRHSAESVLLHTALMRSTDLQRRPAPTLIPLVAAAMVVLSACGPLVTRSAPEPAPAPAETRVIVIDVDGQPALMAEAPRAVCGADSCELLP
jgi:hypothetical protein